MTPLYWNEAALFLCLLQVCHLSSGILAGFFTTDSDDHDNKYTKCTEFPSSFAGCWRIEDGGEKPENFVFFNKSCMVSKNETICGEHLGMKESPKMLCGTHDVNLAKILYDKTVELTLKMSKDGRIIHMANVRCQQRQEMGEQDRSLNNTTLTKTNNEDRLCHKYLTLSRNILDVDVAHNRVIRSTLNSMKNQRFRHRKRGDRHKHRMHRWEKERRSPDDKETFAKNADETAKKLATEEEKKPPPAEDKRRPSQKLDEGASTDSREDFEKKVEDVGKDLAEERENSAAESKKDSLDDVIPDKEENTNYKPNQDSKNEESSFEKDVDSTAEKLAEKERKAPSLSRYRPRNNPADDKQQKFTNTVNNVAKDFAKSQEGSPKAFDSLVEKIAQDLARYIPNARSGGGDKVFIPRGKTVTLDCVRDEETRSPIPPLKAKWKKDGQPLAEGRFQLTSGRDLKILGVESHDSGMFRCDAVITDKNGKRKTVTRFHKVTVYRVPVLSYFFTIKFQTSGCNSINADKVTSHFKSKVCATEPCPLRDTFSKCPASGNKMYIEGKVVLGAEYTAPPGCATVKCKISAMKEELRKGIDKVREFVRVYKSGQGQYGKIVNEDYNYIYSCESGYQQSKDMCTPCYPGFYSPAEDPACHRCPMDTYQENFGALRCLECPGGGETKYPGATSKVNCQQLIKIGNKTIKSGHFMMYIGGSVGLLGLIFMIGTCFYQKKQIKKNPDKSKKEVVKDKMVKMKKKSGKSAKKLTKKLKSKKSKKDKGKSDEEDETNENNSNLMRMPLLSSSQPKYDKNSSNLRRIEEEGYKQSRTSSMSKSKGNTNINNKTSGQSGPGPMSTTSYADFESRKGRKSIDTKSTVRSMSESTASNIRALQNAAIQAKSNANNQDVKVPQKSSIVDDPKKAKIVDNSNQSARVTNTRDILNEGRAKYGNIASTQLINEIETNRRRCSVSSPKKYAHSVSSSFTTSPASSPVKSVYSTPSEGPYPVKHADSWYTSNWDSTEDYTAGSTTTCTSVQQTEYSRSSLCQIK